MHDEEIKRSAEGSDGSDIQFKRRKVFRIALWSLFGVGVVALGIGVALMISKMNASITPPDVAIPPVIANPDDVDAPVTAAPAANGRRTGVYTIILAGTDLDNYHTDTLMVATLDSVNHKLNILSIPRDTQVNVEWENKKINAAWGYNNQDISLLKEFLQSVIGFQPDNYVIVDMNGFMALIDAIGGVDFDVPQRMYHPDSNPMLRINLQAGYQHLDGAEALQVVRFRSYFEGDPHRVAVQHDFLSAVAHQTLSLQNVFKVNEFMDIAKENVQSDLTAGSMIWFLQEVMGMEEKDIVFHSLPGNPDGWYNSLNYFLVDPEETVRLVNEFINPYVEPIKLADIDVPHLNDGIHP